MVIAAGSVMKEPSSGPSVRIENHQAAGEARPARATSARSCSANFITGRLAAIAMTTTTNSGSVNTRPCPR